ncbi:DNA repair exonuclease rad1 [Mariannaea sp. PMI_226]|nr:DNA repair exonuclease rad1 [Mariannaea sp. PMI_226]
MDSSLHEVWQAAAGSPFFPSINKGSQFWVGFFLLLLGISFTGIFALNRSLINVPALGVPASLAVAFGVVYMFCAVGVYLDQNKKKRPVNTQTQPIFRAVATSTRPLYQLLRCISFAPRAHVQITEDGIRFASDHARVMQGVAFLDKALFSSYAVHLPNREDEESPELPNFQISLSSILEVLQIFGAVDVATRAQKADQDPYRSNLRNYRPDAFSNQTLGISGTCTLLYGEEGDPFKITIEEAGVKTTAALTTYLPETPEDIPFDRNDLTFKIIMQARSLLDVLAEIAPTAPTKLMLTVTKNAPYLSVGALGGFGSSTIDFARGKDLLETFSIQERWSQCYKFDFVKSSTEAMRIASKVSLRGDGQGVLSLQFMVDVEGGKRSFLDFRFVPFIQQDEDMEEDADDE